MNEQTVKKLLDKLPLFVSLFPAWLIAQLSSNQWLYALAFWDRETFGNQDSVFENDVGYYVFQYPMLSFVQGVYQHGCLSHPIVGGCFVLSRCFFGRRENWVLMKVPENKGFF